MGEVLQFVRPSRPNELAEIIAWIKPVSNWRSGRLQIALAYHFYMMADHRRILACDAHGRESTKAVACSTATEQAFNIWRAECLKQMFIPAKTVRHLRWKQERLRKHGAGARKLTAPALARDEAALADRLAIVRRQKAGRKAVQ